MSDGDGDVSPVMAAKDEPSVSAADYDVQETPEPESLQFVDHSSLGLIPSSTVTFRGARVHVYDSMSRDEQFLIQEEDVVSKDGKNNPTTVLTVKRLYSGSLGQACLRLTYTLTAALLSSFLFVFCFQIILYLVLNLPVESGATTVNDLDVGLLLGTFLSLPLLLYGMGTLMSLSTSFVSDTWHGGPLVQSITGMSRVASEWLSLTVFLGVPIFTICITLLAQVENFWEVSSKVWVVCVALALGFFSLGVTFREIQTCFRLIQESELLPRGTGDGPRSTEDSLSLLRCAFLLAQTNRYAGKRAERYRLSFDDDDESRAVQIGENTKYSQSKSKTPDKTRTHLYSRLTQLSCVRGLFEQFDLPERIYTANEIEGVQPIYTRHNWSLEEMFCRDSKKNIIMASRGSASLLSSQAYSSLACSAIGAFLIALLVMSLLVWLNTGVVLAILVALMSLLCCLMPMVKDARSLHRIYQTIHSRTHKEGDGHVIHVWETVCVAKPCPSLCYALFAMEFGFLLLWPTVTIFSNNSTSLAVVFLVVGVFSSVRIYIDPTAVLATTGKLPSTLMTAKEGNCTEAAKTELQISKARTVEIVGKVSRTRSIDRWMWIFGTLVVLLYLYFLSTLGSDLDFSPENRPVINMSPDHYYPPKPDLPYPTCELSKGFSLPNSTQLQDFAFLSAIAYEEPNITKTLLDVWLGPGRAVDEAELVERHRDETGSIDVPVWFKLFSFPDVPGFGLVSVRGSQTKWDWLVNIQLWASSGLAQVIHFIMPFGWVWKPILDDLVRVVTSVQSDNLKYKSYYGTVAQFCRDLLAGYPGENGETFTDLRLTGVSLGGGVVGIVAAQTGVNAVSISGPGGVIPRKTFDPPITEEALNSHVFTVIPDRDLIVRVGGRSRLFQEISCTAPTSSLMGCHSMWRTVCELAYTCGSQGRPVLCTCVERFGYPEPEPISEDGPSFAEVCNF